MDWAVIAARVVFTAVALLIGWLIGLGPALGAVAAGALFLNEAGKRHMERIAAELRSIGSLSLSPRPMSLREGVRVVWQSGNNSRALAFAPAALVVLAVALFSIYTALIGSG